MRGRSGHDKAKPQSGRISALAGRQGRLRACIHGLPQSNLQRSRNLVTTSIIKSDGVPRPVAGGGGAFQWWVRFLLADLSSEPLAPRVSVGCYL